ncbi:Protein phosphatase PTC7 [Cichlidogyrus casuarinus]|uniref:Protein phosphatase n=1 Tax=Cichlidogyrus casuarinus TaxID=1844966 RepID=A0ABD2Q0W3_9PLAT
MNYILNQAKKLVRTCHQAKSNNHALAFKPVFHPKLLTAVAGHDNKESSLDHSSSVCKRWVYGDDACFVSPSGDDCVLGVADGVGGWRHYDIDPGQFSQAMVATCQSLVERGQFNIENPKSLIQKVYSEIHQLKAHVLGSATFCLVSLSSSSGRIYAASLGDSGFLVFRDGQIIQRSSLQKHSFNTPFQLACLPPNNTSVQFHHDPPEEAVQTELAVQEGDLLVVGTDGLFDNLTDAMIIQELDSISWAPSRDQPEQSLHDCAKRLVNRAKEASHSDTFLSPFASEARQYGINIVGGVPGDVTVILGLVVNQDLAVSEHV